MNPSELIDKFNKSSDSSVEYETQRLKHYDSKPIWVKSNGVVSNINNQKCEVRLLGMLGMGGDVFWEDNIKKNLKKGKWIYYILIHHNNCTNIKRFRIKE